MESQREMARIESTCFRSTRDLADDAASTLSHEYRILVEYVVYSGSKKPTLLLKRSDWKGTEIIGKTTKKDLRDLWVAWQISDGQSNRNNRIDNRQMVFWVWMEKQRKKHS